ncbi:fumarylacetoacetate hydrolase family protein [Streptomyces niveus]|uniref:fumarylacetoacetate hydrolase family protein n=1 Tax=Streptomyces niveus TaxID=193462 RepID=UPI0036D40B6D
MTVPEEAVGPPVPRPAQMFAVGLNYARHAVETGLAGDNQAPLTFTKFASSIAGPAGALDLPTDTVDWEVELVVVIGRHTYRVKEADAWSVVAGLTLGRMA